jgi:hypothetical protein
MRLVRPPLLAVVVLLAVAAGPAHAASPAFYSPFVHELNMRFTLRVAVLLSGAMELAQETWRRFLDDTPPPRPATDPVEPPLVAALAVAAARSRTAAPVVAAGPHDLPRGTLEMLRRLVRLVMEILGELLHPEGGTPPPPPPPPPPGDPPLARALARAPAGRLPAAFHAPGGGC